MGGGSSLPAEDYLQKSQNTIVRLMMPLYYNSDECTFAERATAYNCWQLVLTDKSPEFLKQRDNENFPYTSSVIFFYDSFYLRLFDIHPMAKALFKNGMKAQGRFLVQMISLSLSELDDKDKFDKTLIKLAEIHNKRGVKAIEYGLVGDVLFWALKCVMGEADYTPQLHKCWVKIYSRMLRTIVPVAVSMEIQDGSAQVNRLTDHDRIFSKGGAEAGKTQYTMPSTPSTTSLASSSAGRVSVASLAGGSNNISPNVTNRSAGSTNSANGGGGSIISTITEESVIINSYGGISYPIETVPEQEYSSPSKIR